MASTSQIELDLSDIERTLTSMDLDALDAVKQTVSLIYAARVRALNLQNSRLLKLPDELLLKIGELLLVNNKRTTTFMPNPLGEDRNRKALLRTCSQLRSKLFPVYLERNRFLIHTKSLEAAICRVCKLVSVNMSMDSFCFTRIFVVANDHAFLLENTAQEAAKLATEIEIVAFGGAQDPPVIIFRLY